MSGNVVLYDKTDEDFDINVSTMSGDVSVHTKDVSSLNLSTNTTSGKVNNYHHMPVRKGKSANIVINTLLNLSFLFFLFFFIINPQN